MFGKLEYYVGRFQHEAFRRVLIARNRVRADTMTIDGVMVPYLQRSGAGTPVVLVHGFGGNKETWLMCTPSLSRGRPLLIPDMPGYGDASPIGRDRATARAQAEAVVRLLDHAGVDRAHLVGNSMGGGISLRVATDYPDRVRSLSLIASVGPVVEKSQVAEALDRGENLLIPTSADDTAEFLSLVAERLPPVPRALRRYVAVQRIRTAGRLHEMFAGWKNSAPADGIPDSFGHIAAPTLVMHGQQDRVIHPSTGRALANQIPRSRLIELDGIGHVPQIEAPKSVGRAIEAFLRSVDRDAVDAERPGSARAPAAAS